MLIINKIAKVVAKTTPAAGVNKTAPAVKAATTSKS